MAHGAGARARRCPNCGAETDVRTARWCGSCGSALTDADRPGPSAAGDPAATGTAGGRVRSTGRWLAGLGAVALVGALVVALVVAGDGLRERTAGGGGVADVAVETPPDEALERVERRRPAPEPVVERPTCTTVEDDGCFAWVAEATGDGFDAVVASGPLLVSQEAAEGLLVARDLVTGAVVWQVRSDPGFASLIGEILRPAGDLLLTSEGPDLVARELATGEERWRTDELGPLTPYQAELTGDGTLVVAGEDRRAESIGASSSLVAGLDAVTGEVRWREGGRGASVGADAVAVVVGEDGELRGYEPTGAVRWRRDSSSGSTVWVHGHLAAVHDRDGAGQPQLHRLRDGEPLGLAGFVVGADLTHSLVELYREGASGQVSGYALFDAEGEVWRTDALDSSGCHERLVLRPEVVEVTTCAGAAVVLDRADGAELSREQRAPADAGWPVPWGDVLAPYDLQPTSPETGGVTGAGEAVVTDTRSGAEVARVSGDTWPVLPVGPGGDHPEDLGVVVLQSQRWLAALDLRSHAAEPEL